MVLSSYVFYKPISHPARKIKAEKGTVPVKPKAKGKPAATPKKGKGNKGKQKKRKAEESDE